MSKNMLAGVLALVLSSSPLAAQGVIGIGTAPQGTMTYTLGATYAKALEETTKTQARVQPSSGTTVMVPLVNSGELDLGFVNSLELTDAYNGAGIFNKQPQKNLRALAVLFPIQSGFFVRKDSPVKSIKDIKGKSIAYGYTSQAILKTVVDGMLADAGLTAADMKTVLVPNIIRGADEFIAGKVDIGYFAVGSAKVAEADAAVGGLRYITMSDDPADVAAMRKIVPTAYIAPLEPAAGRVGVLEPIKIMYYDYTMFANASMKKDAAYKMVKTVIEQLQPMSASMPLFKGMDPARAYRDLPVPYHDGALAYFAEHGIKKTE